MDGRKGRQSLSPDSGEAPRSEVLHALWDRCFRDVGLVPPEGQFAEIEAHYREPHRAYHTFRHLAECFLTLNRLHDARAPGAVGIALWFHDAIYDTRRSDNEAESAVYARRVLLRAGASEPVIEAVSEMILATRHDGQPATQDAQLVVDVDLSILGAGQARFAQYEEQVRREYAWVEESVYCRARIAILEGFLQRRHIFSTQRFRDALEAPARENLRQSIDALSR
jgi:predicted metal-dependent HD superfamily phosphohydrolase